MRMHLRRCDMTAVSSLHIVGKSLLTAIQFEDYCIEQRSQAGLIDVATVIAVENICGYLPYCRELVVVYCNSQSELHVARYEESKTDPVCIKIGEYSSIAGYVSCKIVDQSLLVITNLDKVCIHNMDNANLFAHPLVFSLAVENANMRCNVFSHSAGSLFQWNTLALQFTSTTDGNQIENEWLLLRTSALQDLLLQSDRESSMQDVTDIDSPYLDGSHSSPGQNRSHLWTFVPHAHIDSIASAVCPGLDKLSLYQDELDQYISFASVNCARTGVTNSAKVNPEHNSNNQTVFIAVTKNFELVCYVNQVLQYTKQLPYTSSTTAGSIMLQITNSASNPLLVLCAGHSVLLIDILHSGSVLKEFSNVGACVCASLFHPLTQQLFIIPTNEVGRLGIQSLPGGFVCRDSNTSSENNSSSSDSVISDWFIYELPEASVDGGIELTKCRSMDSTGRWREDARFVIDANAYNLVQWKRQLKKKTNCCSSNVTVTDGIEVESLKRSAAIEDSEISPTKRIKVSHSDARTNSASDSNSSISFPTGARRDLIQTFKDQLHTRREDLLNNTTELQYKQACVDYLRSLVISRAASSSKTYYNLNNRNKINSSANAPIESASIDVGCADSLSDTSAFSRDTQNTWLEQAHKSCTISSSGFTEDNTSKSVYLQRLERMERNHLTPVFGDSAQYNSISEGNYSNDNEDEVSGDMSVSGIVVENIQYKIHPTMQLHCVEVSITLTNNFAHAIYGVKASALVPRGHSSTTIHTTSGVVDSFLPNATATIVMQFTLPQNVFAVNESVDICVNIALNWRECANYWTQSDAKSDGLSEYSRIQNGLTKSRSLGRIVGAVHLNMQEFYTLHTVRTPAQVLRVEDARWQRYMMHKRQAQVQHSPYCIAMPCDSATYMTMRGSTNDPNKIYSCVPSVEVMLTNKSLSSQALDTATELSSVQNSVNKSVFSMDKVLQDLHRGVTRGAHSSELTVSVGEQQEYTVHAGNRCSLVFPAMVKNSGEKSVQCTGTLYAPRICSNLSVTKMGEALLRLRQLLPTEIQVRVALPNVQKRYAVRQAAMCLLEEFKMVAVAKRLQSEKKRETHTRDALKNTTNSEDDMVIVLNQRMCLAKLESDQAIALKYRY